MASKTYLLPFLSLLFFCMHIAHIYCIEFKYPNIFNFGDSNSDTGELVSALGFNLTAPFGQSYFKTPAGRFSDGRLIIDFLTDAMDLPFLNAYTDSIGAPSFRQGCNFAAAGATVLPANAASFCPFSLGVQVSQFLRFKARVLHLLDQGNEFEKNIPSEDYFEKGLYMFDIGQNDLAGAFLSNSLDQILASSIPTILAEFESGIERLYVQGGARNFWVHNTGPFGCLSQSAAKLGSDKTKVDKIGCVSLFNYGCKVFNQQLRALCKKLQGQYADANITYVDLFRIKYDLISNYSQLGFEQPIMACCGYGGEPFNYDSRVFCGQTKILNGTSVTAEACDDSTKYVNWDGIHYTDAANHYVSSQILTGKFSEKNLI